MALCYKDQEYVVKSSPTCYPCLPRCHGSEITYCCDRRPSTSRTHCCEGERECCYRGSPRQENPTFQRQSRRPPSPRVRCRSPPSCCTAHPEYCAPPPVCCSPAPRCCSPAPRCCYSPPPEYCTPPSDCRSCYETCFQPIRTKYVIPCYRYEDGRIVRKLPVTAFKRNGMQDQEHSKLLGTANFLVRHPRDVTIEYDECKNKVHVCDPCKVPVEKDRPLSSKLLIKKPINNQPTVLMRRACEVAVGVRPRRKPFVHSSYSADDDLEGNCCFHFEAKNKGCKNLKCSKDSAGLDFANCVPSTVADPSGCCVYY